jgi:hypothetical protein
MKKTHATDLLMSVFAEGNMLSGVSETETLKANDTSWQQVSITFTPSETGVLGIFARVWAINPGQTGHIGPITVT